MSTTKINGSIDGMGEGVSSSFDLGTSAEAIEHDDAVTAGAPKCATCGQVFQPRYPRELYCGDACRGMARRDRNRKWMDEHRQASLQRVSGDELKRLRLPQSLLEALDYGPNHQLVCLWCGYLVERNLARHLSACPLMPADVREKLEKDPELEASAAYKDERGYDRSNPLMSEVERASRKSSRQSDNFQVAFADKIAPAFAAKRAEQAEARQRGENPGRGHMRLESKLKRTGKKLGPHPDRQAAQRVHEVLPKGMNLRESAKAAKVSENKFYRIAGAADPDWGRRQRERRAVIRRYLFDLRRWIWSQAVTPTVTQVLDRQTDGVLRGAEPYRSFLPFVDALKAELTERPWQSKELVRKKKTKYGGLSAGPVIKLTARILERANKEAVTAANASAKSLATPAAKGHHTQRKKSRLKLTPQVSAALDKLGLTARQKEVAVHRWGHGHGVREIARRLGIDHKAVSRHLTAIEKKAAALSIRLPLHQSPR